jgi:hypothetical protein
MFSLQTIFGKGDKFFGLLEASAEAAHESAKSLVQMLSNRGKPPRSRTSRWRAAARRDRGADQRGTGQHVRDRARPRGHRGAGQRLYKIPKTIQRFAERYALTADKLGDVDFASRAAMLRSAAR